MTRTRPSRRILLARHGETEWNRIGRWQGATDIPLSEGGRTQARALGERLAGQGIRRVYASHLARARETAEIVAATLGLSDPVLIDPRLRERGYGCFEGLTRAECAQRYPEVWERYQENRHAVPPDAEPQPEIIARVTAAMQAIGAALASGDPPVLVISHGGTIRSFVQAAVGVMLAPLANGGLIRMRLLDDGRFEMEEGAEPPDPAAGPLPR